MTMLERVAGAIAKAAYENDQIPPIEIGNEALFAIARAAIEALMEPTEEMLEAAYALYTDAGRPIGEKRSFRAMLKAALEEGSDGR